MPLPGFREDGWLPEGHHLAAWEEIILRFGGPAGSRRAQILESLLRWRDRLTGKGITGRLLLNGSFISAKPDPGDFDAILVADDGVEAVLAQDEEARQLINYLACKEQGLGDIFLLSAAAIRKFPTMCRVDVFDYDKHTSKPKGVVEVTL
jgi:uncharacterized protein DUF6932